MKEVCRLLDVDKLHTTAYKASTNAAIERFHRTLNAMLGKVINERQSDWDLWLPYVMAAYRSTRHESTSFSPNYLLMGREVRAPIDLVLGTGEVPMAEANYDDFVEDVQQRMKGAYDMVRQHIGRAAEKNKKYYDVRVRPTRYQAGDWVYYYNPRRYQGRQDKWVRKYGGPFCVTKVLGPVNVELQRSRNAKPFVVHIDKVKPYLDTPPRAWIDGTTEDSVDREGGVHRGIQGGHSHETAAVIPPVYAVPSEEEKTEIGVDVQRQGGRQRPILEPPTADVVTFNDAQEFRRCRPRRQIRPPARFMNRQ